MYVGNFKCTEACFCWVEHYITTYRVGRLYETTFSGLASNVVVFGYKKGASGLSSKANFSLHMDKSSSTHLAHG